MTWLELIDELKKQPHCLLEKQARVFCAEHDSGEYFYVPTIKLHSPYNDGRDEDVLAWLKHPEEFVLAINIEI